MAPLPGFTTFNPYSVLVHISPSGPSAIALDLSRAAPPFENDLKCSDPSPFSTALNMPEPLLAIHIVESEASIMSHILSFWQSSGASSLYLKWRKGKVPSAFRLRVLNTNTPSWPPIHRRPFESRQEPMQPVRLSPLQAGE